MTALAALLTGFVFALVNAAHCAGMCGAFAMRAGEPPGRAAGLLWYGLGKAFTYAFLGTLAGWLGGRVFLASAPAQIALGVAVGAVLIVAAIVRLVPGSGRPTGGAGLARYLQPMLAAAGGGESWGGRFTLGALTAALPCGVVYLAALQAAATGGAALGLVLMAGFATGTMPVLGAVALIGRRFVARLSPVRARIAGGGLMLVLGIIALGRAVLPLFGDGTPASCCH